MGYRYSHNWVKKVNKYHEPPSRAFVDTAQGLRIRGLGLKVQGLKLEVLRLRA